MTEWDQAEFDRFVIDNGVVGFFERVIVLASGKESNWYANWRILVDDVHRTEQLAEYVIGFTRHLDLQPDCFYGVPEGATKIGIITQYIWAKAFLYYSPGSHALPMGRANQKNHGAPRYRDYVGIPRGGTVVIEDVTTTGG